MPVDQVRQTRLPRSPPGRPRRPGLPAPTDAQVTHESLDRAPGHMTGAVFCGFLGPVTRHVHLAGPERGVVVRMHAPNLALPI